MSSYTDSLTEPVVAALARVADSGLPLTRAGLHKRDDLARLKDSTATELFPNARDPGAALSGLLLRLGGWEESHQAAQDLSTREGDYWHAIVHRMEPDFANAAYWYRRVGQHPIFSDLLSRAASITASSAEEKLDWPSPWDPYFFNTFCEASVKSPGTWKESVGSAIHAAEWELLFRWCVSL